MRFDCRFGVALHFKNHAQIGPTGGRRRVQGNRPAKRRDRFGKSALIGIRQTEQMVPGDGIWTLRQKRAGGLGPIGVQQEFGKRQTQPIVLWR